LTGELGVVDLDQVTLLPATPSTRDYALDTLDKEGASDKVLNAYLR